MIIFVTSHMSYVNQSFIVNAFQFIKKPIESKLFIEEIQRAIKTYRSFTKSYMFPTSNGNLIFKTTEIISLETSYKYLQTIFNSWKLLWKFQINSNNKKKI